MCLHPSYLDHIMPQVNGGYLKMWKLTPIKMTLELRVNLNIQSNVPFYLEIWQNQFLIQRTGCRMSTETQDDNEQNLMPKPGDKDIIPTNRTEIGAVNTEPTGHSNTSVMNQQCSSSYPEDLPSQHLQVTSPKPYPVVPATSGWNRISAVAVLRHVELLNNLWLAHLENIFENYKVSEILPKLQELKTALYDYTVLINRIVMYYSGVGVSSGKTALNRPPPREVLKSYATLSKCINKMNETDLKDIVNIELVLTEENLLCGFLGLNESVVKYLKNIPKEYRNHEPDEYYIKKLLQERVDYLDASILGDTKTCAEKCGFTKVRAKTFATWLETCLLKNHQPLSLWLERYVENMIKYALRLTGEMPRYPLCKATDRPVTVPAERYEEDADGYPYGVSFLVSVRNSTTRNYRWNTPRNKQNKTFWFHGTDHMSALSILQEGIQPQNGRAMQDFSDDDGFYVTQDFAEAMKWAFVWSRPAIIIFQVDMTNARVLDLGISGEAQWKEIVKYNRSGRSRKFMPSMPLRKTFEECAAVLGPSSTDGCKGCRGTPGFELWHPDGYNSQTQQLCIRKDDMAREFGKPNNIKHVIFY